MSLDPVLALLQVSTALGVLYLALPKARYREQLFQRIVNAFEEQEVAHVGDEDAGVDNRVPAALWVRQRNFGDLYHKAIMVWREELPDHYDERLEHTSAWYFPRETGQKPATENEGLPDEYRTFKSDKDVKRVFVWAVVVPIVAMWAFAVGQFAVPMTTVAVVLHVAGYAVAIVGQICVAYYVRKGRNMVDCHGAEFGRALNDAISMIEAQVAESEVESTVSIWTR